MGDRAQITIVDDGRGFDTTNRVERDKGLGLVSMSERTRMVWGDRYYCLVAESGNTGAGDDSDERKREVGRRLSNGRTNHVTTAHRPPRRRSHDCHRWSVENPDRGWLGGDRRGA